MDGCSERETVEDKKEERVGKKGEKRKGRGIKKY